MAFQKGHKLATGRPLGTKNNQDLASLKYLLEQAFTRNSFKAMAKIQAMFDGDDLSNFKWLCELKASLEPKKVDIVGTMTYLQDKYKDYTPEQLKAEANELANKLVAGRTEASRN